MENMNERNEIKFKFLQIPVEMLFTKDKITAMEKFIWARIEGLSKGKYQACTASNEFLATEWGVSPRWISETISKLVKMGWLSAELVEDEYGNTKRKLWTKIPSSGSILGRSLRGNPPNSSPQVGGSGTPSGVKTPPQVGGKGPPKVPPSNTVEKDIKKYSENGSEKNDPLKEFREVRKAAGLPDYRPVIEDGRRPPGGDIEAVVLSITKEKP